MSVSSSEEPLDDGPEWWQQAQRLERQNKLDDAEKLIRAGTNNSIYGLIQTAQLYRMRRDRLLKTGDRDAAKVAHKQAENFAYFFASSATSGGEGTALSRERDIFLKELGTM